MIETQLGFEIKLNADYEQAIDQVAVALKSLGFGILNRLDTHLIFKEKLGVVFQPYGILDVCNPTLAHRVLAHRPEMGLLLPCRITIEEIGPQKTLVRLGRLDVLVKSLEIGKDPVVRDVSETITAHLEHLGQILEAQMEA
jgi:uncharacterized protein (DUF302 family)